MAVLPADHVIPEEKKFQQILADSLDLASRGQVIVTIGIKPTEPATDTAISMSVSRCRRRRESSPYKTTFSKVQRFVEKPHFDKALEYVNSGQ